MVMADDENSNFVGQRRGTESIVAEMVERCEDGGDRLVLLSLRAARGKDPSENRKEQCI
jgi:hypothetical protein